MGRLLHIEPDELFLAGERAPAGTYARIGVDHKVVLEKEDYLPASLDGRVACYMPVRHEWHMISDG